MNGNISKLNIVLVGNYEIGKSIIEELIDEYKGKFFSFISEDSASITIKIKIIMYLIFQYLMQAQEYLFSN